MKTLDEAMRIMACEPGEEAAVDSMLDRYQSLMAEVGSNYAVHSMCREAISQLRGDSKEKTWITGFVAGMLVGMEMEKP